MNCSDDAHRVVIITPQLYHHYITLKSPSHTSYAPFISCAVHSENIFSCAAKTKMRKKSIFFSNYFVGSEKSSTFAPLFRQIRRELESKRLYSSVGRALDL